MVKYNRGAANKSPSDNSNILTPIKLTSYQDQKFDQTNNVVANRDIKLLTERKRSPT